MKNKGIQNNDSIKYVLKFVFKGECVFDKFFCRVFNAELEVILKNIAKNTDNIKQL